MGKRLVIELQNFVMARRDKEKYIRPAVTPITEQYPQVVRVMAIRVVEEEEEKKDEEKRVDSGKRMPTKLIENLLHNWLTKALEIEEIDDDKLGFFEMGLVSHQATYLRAYLRDFFPDITETAAFDYPTINGMVEYLSTLEYVKAPDEEYNSDGFIDIEPRISSEKAEALLRKKIKSLLRVDDFDHELGFFDLGLTSHQMILLRNYLRGIFPDVSPVAAFDYPTLPVMAAHLATLDYDEKKVLFILISFKNLA